VRHHRSRWRLLRKHGKLRYPFLARIILALRHGVEYSVFRLAGPLITQDTAVLRDKLAGKQTLIRGVWSGYRDVAV